MGRPRARERRGDDVDPIHVPLGSRGTAAAAGTTRDNFAGRPVKELQYTAYAPRALHTMLDIGARVRARHGLTGIAVVHRLGTVPVGEESILIAVSAPHRQAAWRAGEEALEECKASVEVWKREDFHGGEGAWRANRDGAAGQRPRDGL